MARRISRVSSQLQVITIRPLIFNINIISIYHHRNPSRNPEKFDVLHLILLLQHVLDLHLLGHILGGRPHTNQIRTYDFSGLIVRHAHAE